MDVEEAIDFLRFFIPILLLVVIFLLSCAYIGNEIGCASYSEVTGREAKTDVLSCYVKHNDSWYYKEEYKFIALKKGADSNE